MDEPLLEQKVAEIRDVTSKLADLRRRQPPPSYQLVNECVLLGRAAAGGDWSQTGTYAGRCLGLGYGAFRALQNETLAADRGAKRLETLMMENEAARKQRRARLIQLAENLRVSNPDMYGQFRMATKHFNAAQLSPKLRSALFDRGITSSVSHGFRMNTILAALHRGLLGLVYAEFGLAYNELTTRDTELEVLHNQTASTTELRKFSEFLRSGQLEIFAAMAMGDDRMRIADMACALAGSIERQLPLLATAQAKTALMAKHRLDKDQWQQAKDISLVGLQHAAVMREAVATHTACFLLGSQLILSHPIDEVENLYTKSCRLAFDAKLPNGKDTPLNKVHGTAKARFIEVFALVAEVGEARLANGKFVSRLELVDPTTGTKLFAAVPYVNLPLFGLVSGCFCRLNGTYQKKSELLEEEAGIEIDVLSRREIAGRSWWMAFIELADPYFQLWPNGANIIWSLGPPSPARQIGMKCVSGASELFYQPLFRMRKGDTNE